MQTSKNQQETWKTQQTTPQKKKHDTPNTHMVYIYIHINETAKYKEPSNKHQTHINIKNPTKKINNIKSFNDPTKKHQKTGNKTSKTKKLNSTKPSQKTSNPSQKHQKPRKKNTKLDNPKIHGLSTCQHHAGDSPTRLKTVGKICREKRLQSVENMDFWEKKIRIFL